MTRWIAPISTLGAVALAACALAVAGDGQEPVKLTPADQAAARAVVLRRADLGSSGWEGGATKPDLSSGLSCPNFHPKVSDLVITGAAQTTFRRSALVFGSLVVILRTRRMVALDWRRSFLAPGAIPCLRRTMSKALGSSGRLVSFTKLPFPRVTPRTALYRAVIAVQAGGRAVRVITDLVFAAKSRTEITLNVAAPASAANAVSAAERRLVRVLVRRARA
ncbi:MAG TPA: hypothetical protein VE688_07535 [Gaiellaceae bacterium]|jgi:hypothetical protein|nr:hypothetical protein [Gaiellaceae bacterium]